MPFRKLCSFLLIIVFAFNSVPVTHSYADVIRSTQLLNLSPQFTPALLHGIIIDPKDPLRFDFIVDKGASSSNQQVIERETLKMAKYFLAGVAIPDEDLWVNLSPYEKNRIVPEHVGLTDIGKDLLAQDFVLKQLTASVIYPEGEVGKKFWNKVYALAQQKFGSSAVAVNTYNRVWIVPQKAVVYQNGNTAFIAESHLKVMLEEDFVALHKNESKAVGIPSQTHSMASDIVREIVVPLLEKEVNEGKNFASLRQIYSAVILANWYKTQLKDALVNQVYANSKKIDGIKTLDEKSKERIYQQYLQAYKKGIYNYIKEDVDSQTGQRIPRKYFSGGCEISPSRVSQTVLDANILSNNQRQHIQSPGNNAVIVPIRLDNASVSSNEKKPSGDVKEGFNREYYEQLVAKASHIQFTGSPISPLSQITNEQLSEIERSAENMRSEHREDIWIESKANPLLGKMTLQFLSGTKDWNEEMVRRGLGRIHFVDDPSQLENPTAPKTLVATLTPNQNENYLAMLLAEYVQPSSARKMRDAALEQESRRHNAYDFAAKQLAYVQNGHEMGIFSIVGERMEFYGVWLAEKFNQALGKSSSKAIFDGEWTTDHRHATSQAHFGSLTKAFVHYLVMNTPGQGSDLVAQGTVNHKLDGFKFSTLSEFDLKAQELAAKQAGREVIRTDFDVPDISAFGRMIQFGQMAAATAGVLSNTDSQRDADFDFQVKQLLPNLRKGLPKLAPGQIGIEQNILNINGNGTLSLGGSIAQATKVKDLPKLLEHLRATLSYLLAPKSGGLEKISKAISGGKTLVHLNTTFSRMGLDLTEAMAIKRFQKYEEVYVAAIGGSLTGDYLARMLKLNNGPKLTFVTDYDAQRLAKIEEDIRNNPTKKAIVVITKSGTTPETDANGSSMRAVLKEALEAKLIDANDIAAHSLSITDPATGNERHFVEETGALSLEHPEHGGRFSMFSTLGLFFYFLKGGDSKELETALNAWDKQNIAFNNLVKRVQPFYKDLNAKDEQTQLKAIDQILDILQEDPGVFLGFLMTFINTLDQVDPQLKRSVQAALTTDSVMGQWVNPQYPFAQQVFVESLSKPGIDFYAFCAANWRSIMSQLNRITTNPNVFVTLWSQIENTPEGKLAFARNQVLKDTLNTQGVPYLSLSTGKMDVLTLSALMRSIYMWLEVSAQAYGDKIPTTSEGQPGVQLPKEIFKALIDLVNQDIEHQVEKEASQNSLKGNARERFIKDRIRELRAQVKVPNVDPDEIERLTDQQFGLSDFAQMSLELKKFLTEFIHSSNHLGGLVTNAVRDEIEFRPKHQVHVFLKERIRSLAIELGTDKIAELIIDGKSEFQGKGDWVIVADSLEFEPNLLSGKPNGTNIAIFKKNSSGAYAQKDLLASVFVQWGSKARAFVSNGIRTQDYELLHTGHLIEISKSADDNRIELPKIGKYAAIGSNSQTRPSGLQNFITEHVDVAEKWTTRYAGPSVSANMNQMLGKGGILMDWLTWPEALMVSQTMEGAGGVAMVMTPQGLRHIHELKITFDQLHGKEQVFVYAGVQNLVNMVQAWMNFLNVRDRKNPQDAAIYRIMDTISNIPENASEPLKASAMMFLLRLQEGLDQFPPDTKLLKEDVRILVNTLRDKTKELLNKLDSDNKVINNLKHMYVSLPVEQRRSNANRYILLGSSAAKLSVDIHAGEETKMFHKLQEAFEAKTSWELIEQLRKELHNGSNLKLETQLKGALAVLKESYEADTKPRATPVYPSLPNLTLGEPLETYMQSSVFLPPNNGLTPEQAEATRQQIFKAATSIMRTYDRPIQLPQHASLLTENVGDKPEHSIKALWEKERSIFSEDGMQIKSLREIMRILRGRKGGQVNASGDVSDRLDHIFNIIFNGQLRAHVKAIISEENDAIVYGVALGDDENKARPYMEILALSDPIDGSSNIPEAGAFGAIFGFGFLKPGQEVNDGTFDPRRQIGMAMDYRFGSGTMMTLANMSNKEGKPELVQFSLDRDLVFKKELVVGNQLDMELDNLEWGDGLRPKPNGHPIVLALGGNLSQSLLNGHREFIRSLDKRYGIESIYSGALNSDVPQALLWSLLDPYRIAMGYAYGATEDKPFGRLRVWFEEVVMGHFGRIAGAELTDGRNPIFNRRIKGEEPSKDQSPLYFLSAWAAKELSAWMNYAAAQLEQGNKNVFSDKGYEEFLNYYDAQSTRMRLGLEEYSKEINHPKSKKEILRALLLWDAEKISFFDLLQKEPKEVYHLLFDNASVGTNNSRDLGGIHLGTGNYLKIIDVSKTGAPVFNSRDIEQFKVNFNGFTPVIIERPHSVNVGVLSGLSEHPIVIAKK